MFSKMTPQFKVGLFVAIVILVLAYSTIRISQKSLLPGGTYSIYMVVESAAGIDYKTPVQIAGVQVGVVSSIDLVDNNKARLELEIDKSVKLSRDVQARIKSLGFLGDTYIELYQPGFMGESLKKGETISNVASYGDFSSLAGELSNVASDVKAITTTLKKLMAGDDSSFATSLINIEKITTALSNVSVNNEQNLNAIISNFRAISENLNLLVAKNFSRVDQSLENVEAITDKVRRGEGTIGKLINDDTTVEKINDSLDNLNDLLGGANKLKVDIGYHAEYLGKTEDFKSYVHLHLKPRPDKYFIFEFIDDPAPDSTRQTRVSTITSGGVTTTVQEEVEMTDSDKFLFSAQFAKELYDFTFRGGIIESSGGAGIDYNKGPVGVQLSAYDLETKNGERPHLKAMGTVNVTKNFYLLGGVDDFISRAQDPDWFMGAGVNITDDDIKSLLGLMKVKP